MEQICIGQPQCTHTSLHSQRMQERAERQMEHVSKKYHVEKEETNASQNLNSLNKQYKR